MSKVTARGVDFHYMLMGNGSPPLAAIHGLMLDNLSSFFFTIGPELAKRHRLLLYDQRGHGRSSRPQTGYSIDELAQDADAVIKATLLSPEPVIVIGHSFGGLIALRLALLRPDLVRGLVLLEAHTSIAQFGESLTQVVGAPRDEQAEKAAELFGNWMSLQKALGADRDLASAKRIAGRIRDGEWRKSVEGVKFLVEDSTMTSDISCSPSLSSGELRAIKAPTLAIYGENSDLRSQADDLSRMLPSCQLMILPGQGHGILWQKRDVLTRPIEEWLEQLP